LSVFRGSQANDQQIRREPQDRPKAFVPASAHNAHVTYFDNRQEEAMRNTVKLGSISSIGANSHRIARRCTVISDPYGHLHYAR